jgi:spectrin beta
MKKHETLELAVEDYADTIRQLGETARQLSSEQHPDRLVMFQPPENMSN